MNIPAAITLLERWQNGEDITSFDDVNRAVKLSIEALKRWKKNSAWPHEYTGGPLPGETQD